MATVRGRIRRLEKYVDAAFEKFVFHHKILGCLLIFIGIPLATLAGSVCLLGHPCAARGMGVGPDVIHRR